MKTSVIKADHSRLPSSGMYSLDLRDISKQAGAMLDAARVESHRIAEESRAAAVREAQQHYEEACQRGFDEGFAKGQEEGRVQALEEARARFTGEHGALADMMNALVTELKSSRERLYLEARRDVIVLATAIASRLVSSLADIDAAATDTVLSVTGEALDLIGSATDVIVHANPDDVVALERFCKDIADAAQSSRHVKIMADASITRGGVILETADTQVDATISERIQRLAEEIAGQWRERAARLSIET